MSLAGHLKALDTEFARAGAERAIDMAIIAGLIEPLLATANAPPEAHLLLLEIPFVAGFLAWVALTWNRPVTSRDTRTRQAAYPTP